MPELREPHALAVLQPWIDVSNVGTLVLARQEGRDYEPASVLLERNKGGEGEGEATVKEAANEALSVQRLSVP